MRLTIAAIVIIIGFLLGVYLVACLHPHGPAWVSVMLTMLWLMALIAGAFLLGNKGRAQSVSREQVVSGLIYVGIASVLVAATIAVGLRDIDNGVHRNYRENWIVTVLTAAIACGYSLKTFWCSRRSRRLWLALAIYLTAHFSILVPALGSLSHVPAFYISLIGVCEYPALFFVLGLVTRKDVGRYLN